MSSLRILVMDDSEIVRDIVAALFTGKVGSVTCVASTSEASAAAGPFDLALLDLSFPQPEVTALARALREKHSAISIFLFSDRAEAVLEELCGVIGADGFLRKSIGPQLVAEVQRRFEDRGS